MDQKVLSTSLTPNVFIDEVQGDLQVKGWERSEIVVRAQAENVDIQEQADAVHIRCEDGCIVRLPWGATLQIGNIEGEARIKRLEGNLTIGEAMGSLSLKEVGNVEIKAVHGELMSKLVNGDLKVGLTEGNAFIKNVDGDCFLERVEGNLELRGVTGDISSQVEGNANLTLGFTEVANCHFEVDGNVVCRIPARADVQINLSCDDENIVVRLPDGVNASHQAEFEHTLGEGKSQLKISSSGNLLLEGMEADWEDAEGKGFTADDDFTGLPEDFGRRISEQVTSQIEAMTRNLNQQMEHLSSVIDRSGLNAEQTERVMRRAREASERATNQAQEKMRRVQEKMDRRAETMRQRSEARAASEERHAQSHGKRFWGFEFPTPPTIPVPPIPPMPFNPAKPQVSDEERLMILRMLEEKKISVDEAEKLLSALE